MFCSGAGGLHRALVLVADTTAPGRRSPPGSTSPLPGTVEIDRRWFRGAGMRSSASHRVTFYGAPVLAVLGPPGALTRQPWFARDAVRTAATWAGAADAAVEDALEPPRRAAASTGDLEALAAGRLLTWQQAIGLWLRARGERCSTRPGATSAPRDAAAHAGSRSPTRRARSSTRPSARSGSRPAATGAPLDRAARDLRLFLLQHRLEPILARTGAAALEDAAMTTFEARYRADPDPWRTLTDPYELAEARRALAACGPGPFASACELGAGLGVLAAALAPRCERLLALDAAPTAVAAAARAARALPARRGARRGAARRPARPERFDLVVASEILYYLDAAALAATAAWAGAGARRGRPAGRRGLDRRPRAGHARRRRGGRRRARARAAPRGDGPTQPGYRLDVLERAA